jgi:hypothetical protein
MAFMAKLPDSSAFALEAGRCGMTFGVRATSVRCGFD